MSSENKNERWWRKNVGGLWDEIGLLQFDYLVKNGLMPDHYLLDIGCGSLRGGIHFIRYLEPRHYFGIDKNHYLLEGGKIEIKENNLISKDAVLKQIENFDFKVLDQQFEFAIAQSVFTHLPINEIRRCIINTEKVLAKNARFYATFFENPYPNSLSPIYHQRTDGLPIVTYKDKDPYHYNFQIFEIICRETGLKVEYIGDWNHPRGQKLLLFTKK